MQQCHWAKYETWRVRQPIAPTCQHHHIFLSSSSRTASQQPTAAAAPPAAVPAATLQLQQLKKQLPNTRNAPDGYQIRTCMQQCQWTKWKKESETTDCTHLSA
jgi:hypothetical protein